MRACVCCTPARSTACGRGRNVTVHYYRMAVRTARPRAVPASSRGRLARGVVPHVLAPTAVPWGGDLSSSGWHAPSSVEAVEDLFWNVDELQARADQPALHALSVADWHPPSKEQRSRLSAARRKRQSAVDGANDSSGYKGYGLTNDGGCPMHPSSSAAVFLPVLKSVAAGSGASILRLGSSPRLRRLLRQRTPHDLALLATGISVSLGTQPLLPEHCMHVMQSDLQRQPVPAWPPRAQSDSPPDVNLVACIQHCGPGDEQNEIDETVGCIEHASHGKPTVWLISVQELFDEVRQRDAQAAELLMEPHYVHRIDMPDHDGSDDDDEEEEEDDYARFLEEEPESTDLDEEIHNVSTGAENFAIFENISHRGKPLAYDISGRPVAFDRPDTRLKATAAAAAARLCANVTVAQSGDERHKAALDMLQQIWDDYAGSFCQEVELHTGDILLADNSVLLSPCLPTAIAAGAGVDASVAGAVQVTLYDELDVLRSCALDRRCPDITFTRPKNAMAGGGKEHVSGRGHMLWLGLQVDSKNLKWWWW